MANHTVSGAVWVTEDGLAALAKRRAKAPADQIDFRPLADHYSPTPEVRVWQCLLTWRSGWTWAARWGAAHESVPPTTNYERRDRRVDLYNNWVGPRLGLRDLGWFPPVAAENACIREYRRGRLWIQAAGVVRWSDGRPVGARN